MLRPVPKSDAGQPAACRLGRCDGSGWILRDDGLAEPCECREQRIGKARAGNIGTGIPKRFRGVSFDRKPVADLDPMVLRIVRTYVDRIDANLDEGHGLWFAGDVGTGKTSLAMLVSAAAESRGRSVAIYPMTRLLAEIKETYDREGRAPGAGGGPRPGLSYMDLFRRLSSVDLLQLDDLGAEKRTEWVLEQLYSIVNERWQDQRAIVVTTNTTDMGVLREELGTRTVSRLTEVCGEPIPIMGPDLRIPPMR